MYSEKQREPLLVDVHVHVPELFIKFSSLQGCVGTCISVSKLAFLLSEAGPDKSYLSAIHSSAATGARNLQCEVRITLMCVNLMAMT